MIDAIKVDISVTIGATRMPIRQLLKMGRGAVIDLDTQRDAPVSIFANDELIARGEIVLLGEKVGVSITERVGRAAA
ncbi:MAG: FliM/FliN family flagellar motor switch protein [Pseudomonadota bacterium]